MNIPALAVKHLACPECGAEPGSDCVKMYVVPRLRRGHSVESKQPGTVAMDGPHQARMNPIIHEVWRGGPQAAERWVDYPRHNTQEA